MQWAYRVHCLLLTGPMEFCIDLHNSHPATKNHYQVIMKKFGHFPTLDSDSHLPHDKEHTEFPACSLPGIMEFCIGLYNNHPATKNHTTLITVKRLGHSAPDQNSNLSHAMSTQSSLLAHSARAIVILYRPLQQSPCNKEPRQVNIRHPLH